MFHGGRADKGRYQRRRKQPGAVLGTGTNIGVVALFVSPSRHLLVGVVRLGVDQQLVDQFGEFRIDYSSADFVLPRSTKVC
jgi:hypothetical protein